MKILEEKRLAEEKAAKEAAKQARIEAQRAEWRRIKEEAEREKADRRRKTKWWMVGSITTVSFLKIKVPMVSGVKMMSATPLMGLENFEDREIN